VFCFVGARAGMTRVGKHDCGGEGSQGHAAGLRLLCVLDVMLLQSTRMLGDAAGSSAANCGSASSKPLSIIHG
jgi:hypothetical protein